MLRIANKKSAVNKAGSFYPPLVFAFKILIHDRVKTLAAIMAVAFSALLALLQTGMYEGYMENASSAIDHSTADIWVMRKGTENFDFPQILEEKYLYRVKSISGVAHVEPMILSTSFWKTAKGGTEGPEIIGIDPNGQLLRPWNMVEGSVEILKQARSVIIDRSDQQRLGVTKIGHQTELWEHRAVVRGFTQGIRSYVTAPVIFTSLRDARRFCHLQVGQLNYLLVKIDPAIDPELIKEAIQSKMPYLEAYGREEFSKKTRDYWSSTTGVGVALFASALMGIFIGISVVALTLYISVTDHLKEYGTLKALGVSNRKIIILIGCQALLVGSLGSIIGLIATLVATHFVIAAGINIQLTFSLVIAILVLLIALCVLASFMAVRKILSVDPALVFQR